MKHQTINILLLTLALLVAAFQFFLAPFIIKMSVGPTLALVLLCIVTTPLHWGLMHESIHSNLFDNERRNRRAGRVLGNFLSLSWDVMRFGHLLHHSHNRHEFDRPEAVSTGQSRLVATPIYFAKLLGGHALVSAVSSVGLALPHRVVELLVPKSEPIRMAALRAFTNQARQSRIRGDLCATILLLAIAGFCWGSKWPIFAVTIAARFVILSLLDNAPHYGTALNSGTYARNTRLPMLMEWLVMGHNFHGVHHGSTGLKWQELRRAFARTDAGYEGGWTRMVLRQFRGPIYLD